MDERQRSKTGRFNEEQDENSRFDTSIVTNHAFFSDTAIGAILDEDTAVNVNHSEAMTVNEEENS